MKKDFRYLIIIGSFWIGIIILSSMFAIGIYQLNRDYTVYGWTYINHVIVNGIENYETVNLKVNFMAMLFVLFIDLLLVLGLYYAGIYEVFTKYDIPISDKH